MGCRRTDPSTLRRCAALAGALALAISGCGGDSSAPKVCAGGAKACGSANDCGGFECQNGCCTTVRMCSSDAECTFPQHCVGGVCKAPEGTPCQSADDCANAAGTPVCDFAGGTCVECTQNIDCSTNNTKVCDLQTHTCEARPGGCARDADCAGDPAGGKCNRTQQKCVECLVKDDCIGTNVCVASRCVPPNQACETSAGCAAPTPVCDTARASCVQCLDESHCASGKVCQNHQCVNGAGCTSDAACANDLRGQKCDTATGACVQCLRTSDCGDPTLACEGSRCVPIETGCTSNAQCAAADPSLPICDTETGLCLECANASHCAGDEICSAGSCVPDQTGCTGDASCAGTPTPKCDRTSGACVECLAGADCPSGLCNATTKSCRAGCAGDANCAAPTPKCRTSDNTCVACVANADCGAGKICRSNACVAGCASDADCASSAVGPKCRTTSNECVACLADADCGAGRRCDQNQCVTIPTGQGDPPCGANDGCAAGTTCLTEGSGATATKTCRKVCNPYAPGTACATDKACMWIGYDATPAAVGACVPKNGRSGAGAACQADDDCERDLLCAPVSATASKCQKLCNPSGGTCGAGDSCHALPAWYDDDLETILAVGICLPTTSNFGRSCSSDYSANNSGGTRPDCGTGMTCGPNRLVLDASIRVSYCQYPVGTGEADTACTDGAVCRTGDCLSGPKTCNTSCRWTSDCTRAGLSSNYKCLPYVWLGQNAAGSTSVSTTGACLPTCKSDAGCPADRACMLTPTFENSGSYYSSFYGYCFHKLGASTGPQKKPGQRCTSDTECESGNCITNGRQGATDGYCSGPCDAASATQCDPARGVVCDPAGVGIKLNDGADGRAGTGDDQYGRAIVCIGRSCRTDGDCGGYSADSTKARACRFTLQVNGYNSEAPGITSQLRTTCEPRVGTKRAGAACASDGECASGSCFSYTDGTSGCFGGCRYDSDCAFGAECGEVEVAGQTFDACVPL